VGVTGDKDLELSFGDLTVEVSKAEDYAQVDASVYSGALDAEPFAISKGSSAPRRHTTNLLGGQDGSQSVWRWPFHSLCR
jgi:hypothetical protein